MIDKLRVMLSTEGTYPFHPGGVSTWCHFLVDKMSQVDFVLYSIIMNPFVTLKYTLPKSAKLIRVPLWGTEEPSEHLSTPFSAVYIAKRYTDDNVVRSHFMPLFADLVTEVVSPQKNPVKLGRTLLEMHRYFREFDYKRSFKSEEVWDYFKGFILGGMHDKSWELGVPTVFDLSQSLGWLYRFLTILNTPLPQVSVTHSAAAAFCGIPCILQKLDRNTPYLLTEHGVYLREQYLSLSRQSYSSYLSSFLVRFIHSITRLNYHFADQVSPVCQYNTRWEKVFGVPQSNIKVIYNGVDRELFSPSRESNKNKYPTVVTIARVDPVKDLITLMQAAKIVRERIPDVRFIVYGSVSVPGYYEECLALRRELDLTDNFIFAGHTDDVSAAYRSGDVVALSSITEAFPYSVVEAMMSGKPVVATDVGGVKEAVGDCGIVVRPRQPEKFAEALINLLKDSELRESLGKDARDRALNYFTIERALDLYLDSYLTLATRVKPRVVSIGVKRQRFLAEKGYALADLGYWQEAVGQFRMAIEAAVDSPAVPVLLTEIARSYNKMGNFDMAFNEMDKAKVMAQLLENQLTA